MGYSEKDVKKVEKYLNLEVKFGRLNGLLIFN